MTVFETDMAEEKGGVPLCSQPLGREGQGAAALDVVTADQCREFVEKELLGSDSWLTT